MQFISRGEQERVIGIISQEYDIIRENIVNNPLIIGSVVIQAEKFLRELAYINKERFFEEDLRGCINSYSKELLSRIKYNNNK